MALYVKFECATCENENCYGHSLQTTEKVCYGYKHTDTNADRLRSMSDEELADWFSIYCCRNKTYDAHCETFKNCEACWLDWLKEEVEP